MINMYRKLENLFIRFSSEDYQAVEGSLKHYIINVLSIFAFSTVSIFVSAVETYDYFYQLNNKIELVKYSRFMLMFPFVIVLFAISIFAFFAPFIKATTKTHAGAILFWLGLFAFGFGLFAPSSILSERPSRLGYVQCLKHPDIEFKLRFQSIQDKIWVLDPDECTEVMPNPNDAAEVEKRHKTYQRLQKSTGDKQ